MREGASSFGNEPHHVSREEELAALRASRNPDITLPPMRPEHKASNVPETPADDRDEWQMAYPRDHLLATIPTVRVETLDQATSRKVLAAEEKTEAWERPATKGAMESLAFPRRKVTADPEATRKMNKQSVEKKESRVTPVLDLRGLSLGGGVVRSSQLLGRGGFGAVYKVHMERREPRRREVDRTFGGGEMRVLKLIYENGPEENPNQGDMIAREIDAARTDSVGLLVDGRRLVTPDGESYIALLLEMAPGEDLKEAGEVLKEGTEAEKHERRFELAIAFRSLVDQLRELHEEGWLHQDVKPSNIRFNELFPHKSRMVDCGIARRREAHMPAEGTLEGSTSYVLPNALWEDWANTLHPEYRDLYALGLSFAEVMGTMRIKEAENILQKFVMAMQGRLIESTDPTDREIKEADISEPTLSEWTRAELRFAQLLNAMVRPQDTREERIAAYAAYDSGKGMSMEAVAREIDEIVEAMQQEGDHEAMTKEEIDILAQSVRDAEAQAARDIMETLDQRAA